MNKICAKCNVEKELKEFHNSKKNIDGRRSICKECKNRANRKYRRDNIDKYKKQERALREKNRDKRRLSQRSYLNSNRENYIIKKKEYDKKYKEKNPVKIRNKKRWEEKKSSEKLDNRYIKKGLKKNGFSKNQITEHLIETYKQILKIKRYVKEKTGKKHPGTKV